MAWTFAVYALVALLLMVVSMALDYAKIAMVVERRRSSILAFLRGLRFVFANPFRAFSLYLVLVMAGGVVLYLYSLVAPGAGQASWIGVFFAFVAGQIYLAARLMVKLWFLASQTHLFQSAEVPGSAPL